MIVFHCHRWDYHNKLRNTGAFFREVVLYAKRKSSNEKEFKNEIFRLMRNNIKWDSFEQYIHVKMPYFSQAVLLDETQFHNVFYDEIDNYLERFNEELNGIEFDLGDDSPFFHEEYEILKKCRGNMKSPQDRDLQLLAACMIYSRLYLPEGILYLVTEDREFRTFAKSITSKGTDRFVALSVDDFRNLDR